MRQQEGACGAVYCTAEAGKFLPAHICWNSFLLQSTLQIVEIVQHIKMDPNMRVASGWCDGSSTFSKGASFYSRNAHCFCSWGWVVLCLVCFFHFGFQL